eukprot:1955614-Rhodomonas_salina.1
MAFATAQPPPLPPPAASPCFNRVCERCALLPPVRPPPSLLASCTPWQGDQSTRHTRCLCLDSARCRRLLFLFCARAARCSAHCTNARRGARGSVGNRSAPRSQAFFSARSLAAEHVAPAQLPLPPPLRPPRRSPPRPA